MTSNFVQAFDDKPATPPRVSRVDTLTVAIKVGLSSRPQLDWQSETLIIPMIIPTSKPRHIIMVLCRIRLEKPVYAGLCAGPQTCFNWKWKVMFLLIPIQGHGLG